MVDFCYQKGEDDVYGSHTSIGRILRGTAADDSEAERLWRMSAYDDVIRTLRRQLEDLNTERHSMMEMMASLNQIQMMYHQGERNITDYGDQVRKVNYYQSMDVVSLGNIRDSIQEYQIR